MPNLEDIVKSLGNDALTDWDQIGEQAGTPRPPLPPGTYQFDVDDQQKDIWSKEFKLDDGRVRSNLMIDVTVSNAKDGRLIGESRRYSISGIERNRARKGQPERRVSDLQFFYRDGLGGADKPKTFGELATAVTKMLPRAKFAADVEWGAYCSEKNTRWVFDQATQSIVEDPTGTKGCGTRYYQSQLAAMLRGEDGRWIGDRITCNCGANLRVRDEVTRFRRPQA